MIVLLEKAYLLVLMTLMKGKYQETWKYRCSAYDRAFETGDYTAQTEKIGGAFDVTAALREAVTYHAANNYQTYMA